MRKINIILFILIPIFSFTQNNSKDDIRWMSLEDARLYAKEYNQNILIYFYKKDCEYCDKMKKNTLSDPEIIKLINNNFYPVKFDSRTKDEIEYNGKKYGNQQPKKDGSWWRHDFYYEVAKYTKDGKDLSTTPTISVFDKDFKLIKSFPGERSKIWLKTALKKIINK